MHHVNMLAAQTLNLVCGCVYVYIHTRKMHSWVNTNIIDLSRSHMVARCSRLVILAAVGSDQPLTFRACEAGCALAIVITAVHSCAVSTAY